MKKRKELSSRFIFDIYYSITSYIRVNYYLSVSISITV